MPFFGMTPVVTLFVKGAEAMKPTVQFSVIAQALEHDVSQCLSVCPHRVHRNKHTALHVHYYSVSQKNQIAKINMTQLYQFTFTNYFW